MGWLDEAKAIAEKKEKEQANIQNNGELLLETETDIAAFKKRILYYYEDATDREMDFAIDKAKERFNPPYSEKEIINYIKQFLD
jgi:hypothetical protein